MYKTHLNPQSLQKIPLTKLIKDQIQDFIQNPWDHLSPREEWKCSDSEEENSVITDNCSIKSPVSPRNHHYTTVLPDVSHFTFEDCETKCEDSEYSYFDENDLATKVKILEAKFDIMFEQRNREREEMMRLHQAMVKLVTDLVAVVSPPNSSLPFSGSPLKPEAGAEPSPDHSTRKEPPQVATEKVHSHRQCQDTVRKQQQLEIEKMVAFIDKRADYYLKKKPTHTKEPYPRVDWSNINSHTVKSLPQPSYLPISGCPQDPGVYPDSPDPKGRVMYCDTSRTQCFIPDCNHIVCSPPPSSTTTYSPEKSTTLLHAITKSENGECILRKTYQPVHTTWSPFGTAAGFETSLGVVAPPAYPIRGYVYTNAGWRLHATPPD